MDRVFLDANFLFSAAYRVKSGLTRLWTIPDITLITSEYAIEEARRNLDRPDQHERLDQLIMPLVVLQDAAVRADVAVDIQLPAKDWPIFLAALFGNATHLLTGDLRHFGPYLGKAVAGIQVMLPADYLRDK